MIGIELCIKECRQNKKISLQKLEEKTYIERHKLGLIEKSTPDQVTFEEAILIARALEVDINELYIIQNYTII